MYVLLVGKIHLKVMLQNLLPQRLKKRLEGKGRILLRKSGTEPLIRVMVECQDAEPAQQCAEEIAEAVKKINYF